MVKADDYQTNPGNQRVLLDEYSRKRGADQRGGPGAGQRASPRTTACKYLRKYPDGPMYTPVTGYYSLIYGAAGLERAADSVLNGTDDRLFGRRHVGSSITGRDPSGGNVVTTIDPRRPAGGLRPADEERLHGSVVGHPAVHG